MARSAPLTRWSSILSDFLTGIWFRAVAFTIGGIVVAIGSAIVSAALPEVITIDIGQDAVGSILKILASSMLSVTIFSLTAMVSAYSSAMTSGTPRSTQLLVREPTSQNALSTFVGSFAFSIVGLVALSLNVYNDSGMALLFLSTLLVIVWILIVLLRWISFLTTFGRMADIINRLEDAANKAMQKYVKDPWSGARPWTSVAESATAVYPDREGFVVRVDVTALQRVAENKDGRIWVGCRAGARVGRQEPFAHIRCNLSGDALATVVAEVRQAFVVERHRTFEQDPRLGVIALSEVSSRALSPGVNDPGTSIEVLSALQRVLSEVVEGRAQAGQAADEDSSDSSAAGNDDDTTEGATDRTRREKTYACDRVYIHSISATDFVADAFRPTARDGAKTVEVAMRVQTEIERLLRNANGEWTLALRVAAVDAFQRVTEEMTHESDVLVVERAHEGALRIADHGRA